MISQQIMRKLLAVEEFPTLPEVMDRILGVTEDEDSSAEQLTDVIERDHVIAVRVLRVANSAFYGHRHPIDSVRSAVVVLGFKSVRLLALATSVFDTLSRRQQKVLDPHDFWMHSLGAAKAAQLLVRARPHSDAADACFTAALLHDMGKFVLALALKEEYAEVIEAATKQRCLLRVIERDLLGTTSAEVGGWLGRKWQLPSHIVSIVSNLFRDFSVSSVGQEDVITVALADRISVAAGFGAAGDGSLTEIGSSLGILAGLDDDGLQAAVNELTGFREETRRFLGLLAAG